MTARVIHVVDEQSCQEGLRLLSLLLRSLSADRVKQSVVIIGQQPALLQPPGNISVLRVPRREGWLTVGSGGLANALATDDDQRLPMTVHAWGTNAAAAARSALPVNASMLTTITDPDDVPNSRAGQSSIDLTRLPGRIVCTSSLLQTRLEAATVQPARITLIPPAAEFEQLSSVAKRDIREQLHLPSQGRVFLTTSPPTRAGGQFFAVWAAAILHQIWPDAHMVVPGVSTEQKRIARLVDTIYCPHIYRLIEDRYTLAELLAVSDALLVPAIGDMPVGWLAAAMAASIPIFGSNVPSVADIVTDGQTGFLCTPGEPQTLAIRVRTAFETPGEIQHCVENARRQAADRYAPADVLAAYRKRYEPF